MFLERRRVNPAFEKYDSVAHTSNTCSQKKNTLEKQFLSLGGRRKHERNSLTSYVRFSSGLASALQAYCRASWFNDSTDCSARSCFVCVLDFRRVRAVVVVICCEGPPFIKVKWPSSDLLFLGRGVGESYREQHVGMVDTKGLEVAQIFTFYV